MSFLESEGKTNEAEQWLPVAPVALKALRDLYSFIHRSVFMPGEAAARKRVLLSTFNIRQLVRTGPKTVEITSFVLVSVTEKLSLYRLTRS